MGTVKTPNMALNARMVQKSSSGGYVSPDLNSNDPL